MSQIKYSLSWDAHQNKICQGLSALQQKGEFVDMTLAADGHHVQVHKMVMSLASPYIKELIATAQCPHPVIFLNNVSYNTLCSLLEYVYMGEAIVAKEDLSLLLEASKALHIHGLEKMMESPQVNNEINSQMELPNIKIKLKQESVKQIHVNQNDFNDGVDGGNDDEGEISFIDDDDDETQIEVQNDEVKHKNNMKPSPTDADKRAILENHSLQYTLSSQGNLQIVLNRYIYNLRYSGKTSRRLWRCVQYPRKQRCPAYVITQDNLILERKFTHSHPFHDKKILKKFTDRAIFSEIDEAEKKLVHFKKRKESIKEIAYKDTKDNSLPTLT